MITLLGWKCSVFFKTLSPREIPADWSSCCFCYKPHCQQNAGCIPFHFLNFLIITMNILARVPVQYVTLYYFFFLFFRSFHILVRDFQCETLTTLQSPTISEYSRGLQDFVPQAFRHILATRKCMETVPTLCLHQPHGLLKEQEYGKLYLFSFLSSTLWNSTSWCLSLWIKSILVTVTVYEWTTVEVSK